jgi:hypothetical protein
MVLHSTNGNGGAVILPPTPKVIRGRSLAHKRLDKRQGACLAADVIEGLTVITPTQAQVATMCGVSLAYVRIALGIPPGKRAAILRGWDSTPFAALITKTGTTKVINTKITDTALVKAIRAIGTERVLNAAVVAETAE